MNAAQHAQRDRKCEVNVCDEDKISMYVHALRASATEVTTSLQYDLYMSSLNPWNYRHANIHVYEDSAR